jgi:hypothetical protein
VSQPGAAPRDDPHPVPEPSTEEVAAMVAAAVEALLGAAGPAEGIRLGQQPSHVVWRFSGRWWARPTVARRDRPWTAG